MKYKLRSQTTRKDEAGKKRHSADIEILSIDPEEKIKKLSARAQLDRIINFGPDPRPRNPLGEFSGDDDGTPSPHAMKITYGGARNAVLGGAAAGVTGAGATVGLKALIEKLRKK